MCLRSIVEGAGVGAMDDLVDWVTRLFDDCCARAPFGAVLELDRAPPPLVATVSPADMPAGYVTLDRDDIGGRLDFARRLQGVPGGCAGSTSAFLSDPQSWAFAHPRGGRGRVVLGHACLRSSALPQKRDGETDSPPRSIAPRSNRNGAGDSGRGCCWPREVSSRRSLLVACDERQRATVSHGIRPRDGGLTEAPLASCRL